MKKFLAVVVTVCSITGFLVSGVSAYAMSTKDTGVKDETGVEIKVPSTYKLVSDGAYETPNGAISVTVDKVAILNGDNLDADCVKQVLDTYGDTVTFDKINQNGNAFYTVGLMKYKDIGNIVILAKFWNIGSEVYREQIVGGSYADCTRVYSDVKVATVGKGKFQYNVADRVNEAPSEADLIKLAKKKSIQFLENPQTFKIKVVKVKGDYFKGSKGYWYLKTDGICPKKGSQVYLTILTTTWGTSAKARKTSSDFIAQGRVDPVTR